MEILGECGGSIRLEQLEVSNSVHGYLSTNFEPQSLLERAEQSIWLTLYSTMSPFTCFLPFAQLPHELQEEIWSFACIAVPAANPRIHRIAPTSREFAQTASLDSVEINIIAQPPTPVPSLLHACRGSRKAALKVYELWHSVKLDSADVGDRKYIFVSKPHDIFYFGQQAGDAHPENYWFLYTLVSNYIGDTTERDVALSVFLKIINGIEHWAFDWNVWSMDARGYDDSEPLSLWIKTLFKAKRITFTLGDSYSSTPIATQHTLQTITRGNIHAKVANEVWRRINYDRKLLHEVCPRLKIPELDVMFISAGDTQNEDSSNGEGFLEPRQYLRYDFIHHRLLCRIEPGPEWILNEGDPQIVDD